jgi:hypothetical protein
MTSNPRVEEVNGGRVARERPVGEGVHLYDA